MNRGVKRRLELDCHVDVLMGLRVGIEMGMEKQIGRVGWKAKRGLGLLRITHVLLLLSNHMNCDDALTLLLKCSYLIHSCCDKKTRFGYNHQEALDRKERKGSLSKMFGFSLRSFAEAAINSITGTSQSDEEIGKLVKEAESQDSSFA